MPRTQNMSRPGPTAEKWIDLNDLRVFANVASLANFSAAAEALHIHRSTVSRSIVRLELLLETRLLQRTTRKVLLTRHGNALKGHCEDIRSRIEQTIGYAGCPCQEQGQTHRVAVG